MLPPDEHMVELWLREFLKSVRFDRRLDPEYCVELPEHPPVKHEPARTIHALTLSAAARKKISNLSSKP